MIAEILSIGNEVVDGSVVNTNASWLSQQLSHYGVEVRYHTAIPDDEALMLEAFGRAQGRASVVLGTGGLGPTVDDFTLEVAAKYFGRPMVRDQESFEKIQKVFKKLERLATPNQEKQAMVPEGSTVMINRGGTAPGVYYLKDGVHFAFFPGVPSEMKAMFRECFLPILLKIPDRGEQRVLKVLRCFGLPEGHLDQKLREEIEGRVGFLGGQLGFRVRFPTIDIRLYAFHADLQEAEKIVEQAAALVREKLGEFIFGEDEVTLAEVVGGLLKSQGKTLATAESCTGGFLANEITDVPGASDYFLEGVVTYSNEAKMDLLGVKKATLDNYGAVSSETALEMAKGIRQRAGADLGVSVTGIAGPSGGTEEKPAGTVHLAVDHVGGQWQKKYHFPFGRVWFKQVTSAAALDRVRRILRSLE